MVDKSQIPFLLKLIDDPSPTVRARVAQRLRAFGPGLWQEIDADALTPEQHALLDDVLHAYDNHTITMAWRGWQHLEGEPEKLEEAFRLLSDWQIGQGSGARLSGMLQALADEYTAQGALPHPRSLSSFLFETKCLRGPASDDYYNPLNSDLVHALESGAGIPITLASIFILVGHRLGVTIHGCAFPGHFLARAHEGSREYVFDCFDAGRILSGAEMVALRKAAPEELSKPATAVQMIARVLHNLAAAFHQAGDNEKARFMLSLRNSLELIER